MSTSIETLTNEALNNSLFGQSSAHIHWFTPTLGVHKAVATAFTAMQTAANQDNIDLAIASGFRDFSRQQTLWNNKVTGIKPVKDINNNVIDLTNISTIEKVTAIMLFSAIPGLSRHHWGTDIDVYSPSSLADKQGLQLECWEYQPNGPMAKLSQWLLEHANSFGFYFPYDCYRNGIAPEPWHLSFWPIAEQYQQQLTQEKFINFVGNVNSHDLDQVNANNINIVAISTIMENLPMLFNTFINNINNPCSVIKGCYHG